jgi:hypothetical protein
MVDADDTLASAIRAVESVLQQWPVQYRRMLRQRAQLRAPMPDEEHQRDAFYDFFVAAYHLGDWLRNDDTVDQKVRNAAWAFRHTGAIGLAGDVANGFKHLTRDRPANVDEGAHVSNITCGFTLDTTPLEGTGPVALDEVETTSPKAAPLGGFVIAGNQTWEDAFEVADRCIAQWDAFLRDHALQP